MAIKAVKEKKNGFINTVANFETSAFVKREILALLNYNLTFNGLPIESPSPSQFEIGAP